MKTGGEASGLAGRVMPMPGCEPWKDGRAPDVMHLAKLVPTALPGTGASYSFACCPLSENGYPWKAPGGERCENVAGADMQQAPRPIVYKTAAEWAKSDPHSSYLRPDGTISDPTPTATSMADAKPYLWGAAPFPNTEEADSGYPGDYGEVPGGPDDRPFEPVPSVHVLRASLLPKAFAGVLLESQAALEACANRADASKPPCKAATIAEAALLSRGVGNVEKFEVMWQEHKNPWPLQIRLDDQILRYTAADEGDTGGALADEAGAEGGEADAGAFPAEGSVPPLASEGPDVEALGGWATTEF